MLAHRLPLAHDSTRSYRDLGRGLLRPPPGPLPHTVFNQEQRGPACPNLFEFLLAKLYCFPLCSIAFAPAGLPGALILGLCPLLEVR